MKTYPTLEKITIETPKTVIDDVWKDSISKEALKELKRLTKLKSYKKILKKFEGSYVEELLEDFNK